jgi:hypothetical protein
MTAESKKPNTKGYKPQLQDLTHEALEPERECSSCHELWPLDSDFWRPESESPEGFATECRACLTEKRLEQAAAVRRRKFASTDAADLTPIDEKPCNTCKVSKPLSKKYFRVDHRRSSGFSLQCNSCRRAVELESVERIRASREAAKKDQQGT